MNLKLRNPVKLKFLRPSTINTFQGFKKPWNVSLNGFYDWIVYDCMFV